ncbi:hypothetical protein PINS_up010154 [Pythium insidiosum]|nr:hypothetical protein PINS_up010154 [Pythium insidiosum]
MAPPTPSMAASAAPGRHDELLLSLAQQHSSIESLLDSFFDFLHRKTDFYVVSADPVSRRMGFRPGDAQRKVWSVLEAFGKYPLRDVDAEAPVASRSTASSSSSSSPRKVSISETQEKKKEKEKKEKAPMQQTQAPVKLTDKGKQLPIGNGGITDKYTWTQTLEDVTVLVPVPEGTSAKQIECDIRPQRLRVAVRSSSTHSINNPSVVLLDGEFPEKIRADESLWSLENGHTLQLSLEKIRQTWWASVLRGDAEIDTSEVDSTRAIGEYDAATQGAIRKAMFDQQQRQLGLPTSEELATQELLAKARLAPNSPI